MPNKYRVVVTAEASANIEAIGNHVALDSALQAARWLALLYHAIDDLGSAALHYPVILTRGEDAIRRRVVGSYNVIYWVDGDRVEVVHVVHGARNLHHILFPDED